MEAAVENREVSQDSFSLRSSQAVNLKQQLGLKTKRAVYADFWLKNSPFLDRRVIGGLQTVRSSYEKHPISSLYLQHWSPQFSASSGVCSLPEYSTLGN